MDRALTLRELQFSKEDITSKLLDEYFIALLASSQILDYEFIDSVSKKSSITKDCINKFKKMVRPLVKLFKQ